jgi:hypothetical protein
MCQQKLLLYCTAQRITLYLLGDGFGGQSKKIIFFCATNPQWTLAFSFVWFSVHTQRRIVGGRTGVPPVGFERPMSVDEWPLTYSLDRSAIQTDTRKSALNK